jgi:hypothetical protein
MTAYKMVYTDFEIAAQRHLESCYHIIDNINSSRKTLKGDNRLLWNTYYLSGYVIECSLKLAYFKTIVFEKTDDIITLPTWDKLKTHDLNLLLTYLENVAATTLPSEIPYVNQRIADDHRQLVNKWNSEIRYAIGYAGTVPTLNINLIKSYLDAVVKPIFDKLSKM